MRIIVSVLVSVLACFVVAAPPMSGQVAGDSIRIRIPPSSDWTHGRFVSRDSGQLMVSQTERDQSYPLQSIGRLEVRRRKNPVATVVGTTVACAAGAALAGVVRARNRRAPVCRQRPNITGAAPG